MIKLRNIIQATMEMKCPNDVYKHYKNTHCILMLAIKEGRDILDIKDEIIEYNGKQIIKTTIKLTSKTVLFT